MRDGLRVVDIHTHVAPLRLARAVRAALEQEYGWQMPWPVEPAEVLADIRASGADLIVHHPYAHRPGVARSMNEHSAALAAENTDVIGFATVHPDDPDSVGDLEDALSSGVGGLKVHCVVQRCAPDDSRLEPVLAYCERNAIPVLMHAGHGPDADGAHTGLERFTRLMRRHPELRVCVAHLGAPEADGFLALVDRHQWLFVDCASVADNRMATTGVTLDRLHERADRFLYGSDYPNTHYAVGFGVPYLREAGFAGEALAAVLGTNALRFLGLPTDRC